MLVILMNCIYLLGFLPMQLMFGNISIHIPCFAFLCLRICLQASPTRTHCAGFACQSWPQTPWLFGILLQREPFRTTAPVASDSSLGRMDPAGMLTLRPALEMPKVPAGAWKQAIAHITHTHTSCS